MSLKFLRNIFSFHLSAEHVTGVSVKLPHTPIVTLLMQLLNNFQTKTASFTHAAIFSSVPVFFSGRAFGAKTDFCWKCAQATQDLIKLLGIYWNGCVKKESRTWVESLT